ncbi:hypothetical protein, partial [Leptospira yasudae]
SGAVYVADYNNNAIRKVSTAGVVTTFAGSLTGVSGFVNATGTEARFFHPNSIAVDSNNAVYVADEGNWLIRMISPSGVVETHPGSPKNSDVQVISMISSIPTLTEMRWNRYGYGILKKWNINNGFGSILDSNGTIYAVNSGMIWKIYNSGVISLLAGDCQSYSKDGTGLNAGFGRITGIVMDSTGNLFVSDDNTVRKITSNGVVTTFAGAISSYGIDTTGYVNGVGTAARFNQLFGIAIDSADNLYVADAFNNVIRKITKTGVVTTFAGSGVKGYVDANGTAAQFNRPFSIIMDSSGTLLVYDAVNQAIRTIAPNGDVGTLLNGFLPNANSDYINFVAVDGAGNLYYRNMETIGKLTPSGVISTLSTPFTYGFTVDSTGLLYVLEPHSSGILKTVTGTGVVTPIPGILGP